MVYLGTKFHLSCLNDTSLITVKNKIEYIGDSCVNRMAGQCRELEGKFVARLGWS
jgi:hypothetical protein